MPDRLPAVIRAAVAGLIRLGLAAFVAVPAAAQAAPVLVVDTIAGEVSAELLGTRRALKAGDVIHEREVLTTVGPASRLSLRFADEGLLELGADAMLAIEKLPPSADAADLRSLVSLRAGYLRVLWTPAPARAVAWPFHLFFGGQRATLVPGEYFFERGSGAVRSCVASGRLTITAIAGDGVEALRAGACYELQLADAARRQPRSAASWEAVRREFTTNPTGTRPEPPARESAAPVVADAAPPAPPAPLPAGSAGAPTGKPAGWTLLLGSYGDPGNAAQVADKLRAGGYEPFTRIKEVDGKTWHSVQVRGYPSREVADAKAADVAERLRIRPVKVVLLP